MTKNKKRKSALREISAANGVSMTRAALLNDRGREVSALDEILNREKNLAWTLQPLPEFHHLVGESIQIHCDSNSPDTLLWGAGAIRQKLGVPHYVIDRGTREQHIRFLDGIRSQIDVMPEARSEQIGRDVDSGESDIKEVLRRLESEKQHRDTVLGSQGFDHFADLRVQSLRDSSPVKVNMDFPYLYVFIYDWAAIMPGKSDAFVNQFRALIASGKRTGIHFIVATSGAYTDVSGGNKQVVLKNILIRNIEDDGLETAGMFCHREWVKMAFPSGPIG